MKTQTTLLALILFVLFAVRPQLSFSRNRSRQAPPPPHIRQWQREQEQRRQQFQRRHEELVRIREEYESEAYQEALGVDAEQWMKIKPLVDRINELRVSPFLRFSVYGFSGLFRIMNRCTGCLGRPRKLVRGPRGTNFPPRAPNLSLCPNDFSLRATPGGLLCQRHLRINRMNPFPPVAVPVPSVALVPPAAVAAVR